MREARRWTMEEKNLLWTIRSNHDIAEELGRSVVSVKNARFFYTGHYCPREYARPKKTEYNGVRSEIRILDLAKKIGVKLEGVR